MCVCVYRLYFFFFTKGVKFIGLVGFDLIFLCRKNKIKKWYMVGKRKGGLHDHE